ncbi:MAG: hypothetical protein HY763_11195 [Planctomycetes bacterium]|nr:hypothetical protein [Planctomycetota bacterium]
MVGSVRSEGDGADGGTVDDNVVRALGEAFDANDELAAAVGELTIEHIVPFDAGAG